MCIGIASVRQFQSTLILSVQEELLWDLFFIIIREIAEFWKCFIKLLFNYRDHTHLIINCFYSVILIEVVAY